MFRAPILLMCVVSLSLLACEKAPTAPQAPVTADMKAPAPSSAAAPTEPNVEPKVEEAKPPVFEGAGSAGELVLLSFKAMVGQDFEQVQGLMMPGSIQQKYCPKQEVKTLPKDAVVERMAACKNHFGTRLDGAQPFIDTYATTYSPQELKEDSALCEGATVYFSDDITYQTDTPETGILQYIFKPGQLLQVDGKWWLTEAPDCFFNAPG